MAGPTDRRGLVDRGLPLPVSRQCELVGLARSTFYSRRSRKRPAAFTEEEERAMAIMDEEHAANPSYGARSHMRNLESHGISMGRRRVARLMGHMGIRSIAPMPSTSAPAKHHPRFPYLLKGKAIRFPNQVWSTDITYVPLGRGHVYLSAVIDWRSRYIVGWRLHDTLEARECVACMERAFAEHGTPAVCNSDQGSTYTSDEYVACLAARGVEQSMDGKGRWADNVYIERWFRDLKHYCIYQREYSSFGELRRLIAAYVDNYNNRKLHGGLGYETPASWYYSGLNNVREMGQKALAA